MLFFEKIDTSNGQFKFLVRSVKKIINAGKMLRLRDQLSHKVYFKEGISF